MSPARDGAAVTIAVNARVADGKDPSWLWDVPVRAGCAAIPVAAAGERSLDVAVRLRYADVEPVVEPDPIAAAARAPRRRACYIIASYTQFSALYRRYGTERARDERAATPRCASGSCTPSCSARTATAATRVVLVQRCRWRGIPAELVEVGAGEPIPDSLDVYLFGGGEDDPQLMAAAGMRASRAGDRARACDGGAVVFAVCAGFQLLGHRYDAADGAAIEGVGLVDVVTTPGPSRLIGEVVVEPSSRPLGPGGPPPTLTGFENHGGRTTLGDGARAARSGARRRRQRRRLGRRRRARRAARLHLPARSGAPAQPGARRPGARVGPAPSGRAPRRSTPSSSSACAPSASTPGSATRRRASGGRTACSPAADGGPLAMQKELR